MEPYREFLPLAIVALALALLPLAAARAQYIQSYFPSGIPGFAGGEAGVPVQARARSLYDAEDIHLDGYDVRAQLSESIAYNSDVEGIAGGPGSFVIESAPSIEIDSDWARDALDLVVSADNQRYLALPLEDNTGWSAALGGTVTLGRGDLTLGVAYLNEYQLGSQFGALETSNPVPFKVFDARAAYGVETGRFTLTPNLEFQQATYGAAIIDGVAASQSYRNTQLVQGGLTTLFDLGGERSLLLVLKGAQISYTDLPRGVLNEGATSVLGLFGLDYQTTGVFRYRLLAGLETRSFVSPVFGSQTAPIAEASVIWTPTGLTTVTDTLAREIESPASTDVGDFTYTSNSLVIDHELRRNILLQGRFTAQLAEYLHQSSQDSLGLGAGITWLISKVFRLTADYNFSRTSGQPTALSVIPGGQRTPLSGNFADSRFMLTLRVTP